MLKRFLFDTLRYGKTGKILRFIKSIRKKSPLLHCKHLISLFFVFIFSSSFFYFILFYFIFFSSLCFTVYCSVFLPHKRKSDDCSMLSEDPNYPLHTRQIARIFGKWKENIIYIYCSSVADT